MTKYIYTIRDTVANSIGPLFVMDNDEVAQRAVRHSLASGKDDMMSRCPGDFELVSLGSIDVLTGDISDSNMRLVCVVNDLVQE